MAFLTAIAEQLNQPGGLWEWLILKVFGFISNYGWRILLFVILLKVVLFPLDLFQRIKMRKNQLITERMKPQLEKLQQQYAGDKQMLAQKQMELNKKEGFSYFSSCLPMLVTMAIFFYLFAGLNNISQYMNLKQYAELYDTYTVAEQAYKVQDGYDEFLAQYADESKIPNTGLYGSGEGQIPVPGEGSPDRPAYDAWKQEVDKYSAWLSEKTERETAAIVAGQDAVVSFYNESKESFLWIKNIWSPDVPWTKPILSKSAFERNIANYANYDKMAKKLKVSSEDLSKEQFNEMISTYGTVTDKLYGSEENKTNGLLILPILSVGLSFLSQFITSRLQKQSGQTAPTGGMAGSMKVMMIIMPLMMGFFALQYTSAFTLYIVVNSAMTILINVFTSLGMGTKDKKKKKVDPNRIQKYGRPDPKDL